jgi:hypothetical protein
MPLYSYVCGHCGQTQEHYATVDNRHEGAPVCHGKMELEIVPTMVIGDITPYKAVSGDRMGQMISSRREHKEFLKRNRFVEVGNEPIRPIKNDFRPRRGEIAQELKRVIPTVLKR